MIRGKFYKDIIIKIDSHERFESYDFKISSESNAYNTMLEIEYKIQSEFLLTFKIPSSVTSKEGSSDYYLFSGTVCPGPISYQESFNFKGLQGIFNTIERWLDCIWEELTSNPIVKYIESQQEQINDIFEKFDSIDDEYFTKVEAEDLKNRLDELEKTLKDEAIKLNKDKELLQNELIKLHTDIETLKLTITSLNKNGWLKSFTGKIFKWTSKTENRALLKDGFSLVKAFLPENIRNDFPPFA